MTQEQSPILSIIKTTADQIHYNPSLKKQYLSNGFEKILTLTADCPFNVFLEYVNSVLWEKFIIEHEKLRNSRSLSQNQDEL